MKPPPIIDPDVKAVFAGHDPATRKTLKTLRATIYAAAVSAPDIGPLTETLKWGQLSYHPEKPRVGTTVRIDRSSNPEAAAALFVPCQTNLLETFRNRYPDTFTYAGKRAIELDHNWQDRTAELQHCIALALSYHLCKANHA
ncbi:MAG: DUF1801 domain-containing protein [Hyphomicrobiaceae bacterium]